MKNDANLYSKIIDPYDQLRTKIGDENVEIEENCMFVQ